MKTNIGLLLTKRAHLNPDREAYVESDGSRRYTFKELNERSNCLANALKANGLQKGDRVGLLLMNSVEFMESFFAIGKVGGVVVPLNWRLVADELEFILKSVFGIAINPNSFCCNFFISSRILAASSNSRLLAAFSISFWRS